ncbi:hypothetical protein C8R45DRAFT_926007 [Mycena sanguinolenta]|nr:hypothetical protein C8R45DRAFT_926007 [Mycena sanguinolenta]
MSDAGEDTSSQARKKSGESIDGIRGRRVMEKCRRVRTETGRFKPHSSVRTRGGERQGIDGCKPEVAAKVEEIDAQSKSMRIRRRTIAGRTDKVPEVRTIAEAELPQGMTGENAEVGYSGSSLDEGARRETDVVPKSLERAEVRKTAEPEVRSIGDGSRQGSESDQGFRRERPKSQRFGTDQGSDEVRRESGGSKSRKLFRRERRDRRAS